MSMPAGLKVVQLFPYQRRDCDFLALDNDGELWGATLGETPEGTPVVTYIHIRMEWRNFPS